MGISQECPYCHSGDSVFQFFSECARLLVLLSGLHRKLSCKSMITKNILVHGYGHFHCSLTLATSDTMMKCFGCGRVRHLVQDSPPKRRGWTCQWTRFRCWSKWVCCSHLIYSILSTAFGHMFSITCYISMHLDRNAWCTSIIGMPFVAAFAPQDVFVFLCCTSTLVQMQ